MKDNVYPRAVTFETANPEGFTPEARSWLERLRKEVRMTMPAENILRIEYPSDIVTQIRTVNVDGCIYRLDFISPEDRFFMCDCVFPSVPWNSREFMNGRWAMGCRSEGDGVLTIIYPPLHRKITVDVDRETERKANEFLHDFDIELQDNGHGATSLDQMLRAIFIRGAKIQKDISCRVDERDMERTVQKFCRENDLNYKACEAYDLVGNYTNEDLKELVAEAIEFGYRSAKKEK